MDGQEIFTVKNAEATYRKKASHVPSTIQADTLFTFMPELRFLIQTIQLQMLSPRYCTENVRYLQLDGIKDIAFPMKCFCDINLHRLGDHLSWYGSYGIAFSKEWGMERGVQPVQYINQTSELRKDFTRAFNAALKTDPALDTAKHQLIYNYLLHQLAFVKPYSGMMKSRLTGKNHRKCLADECEWRFVPDVESTGFDQAYYDEDTFKSGQLVGFSDSMAGNAQLSLLFSFSDIKYLIVKDTNDSSSLAQAIMMLQTSDQAKYELLSKIIIWETAKGDF